MLDLEMVTWKKLGQSYVNNTSGEDLSSKEVIVIEKKKKSKEVRYPNSNFNTSHTTVNEKLLNEK